MKNQLLALFILSIIFAACNSSPESVEQDVKEMNQDNTNYTEQHRPQFHFSPKEMWMNDPNGMVYYEGEYHLFYQYYPDSTVWGPMHWGHAVSKDLTHWEHLPIGIYPDELGYIFSGSAVVDWNNTTGFGKDGQAPLIAIYTYHDPVGEKEGKIDFQTQGIAYSNDKGRTWTKYDGNPVIPNPGIKDFRDPKVIWDATSKQWLMVFAAYDHSMFWASPDLKSWTHLSNFGKEAGNHGGVWECPDFFPMKATGTDDTKWVLLQSINPGGINGGSATQYFIGDFDGKQFTLDSKFAESIAEKESAMWLDYGRDNYAGVTWSDVPEEDGRRIFIGWMSNWDYAQVVPTGAWRSAMTIARTIELKKTAAGYRLFTQPVEEMKQLRGANQSFEAQTLNASLTIENAPQLMEVIIEATVHQASTQFGLELSNAKGEKYRIGFNSEKNVFFSDRRAAGKKGFSEKFAPEIHPASRSSQSELIKMHVFIDVASAELFADDGATVITDIFFPNEDFNMAKIFVEGGKIDLKKAQVFELKSIW